MVLLIVFLFQNYEAFLSATTLELRLPALPPLTSTPIPLYGLILGSVFGGGLVAALYIGSGQLSIAPESSVPFGVQNNGLQDGAPVLKKSSYHRVRMCR